MASVSGCRTIATIEPFCLEGYDFRASPARIAEFERLLDRDESAMEARRPQETFNLRWWIVIINQEHRYNCRLAGKEP